MPRPAPFARADFRHFRPIATRWADNDIYGHVNNAHYYQFFDTAVNGWLLEAGILDFAATETVFLVVETGCTYFSEIAFPDTIHAGIRVARLGSSSVTWEIALFSGDAATAAAQGHFVHVNVGRDSRRPVAIGEPARGLLRSVAVAPA